MSNIVKVISTSVKNSRLYIKFFRKGKSDVQEVPQVAPFGIEGNPIKDSIAVYSKTLQNGEAVILGYIPINSLADVGELRLYSTNADGVEQTYTLFKNDGNIELNGNTKNLVRFQDLETGLDANALELKGELVKIAAAINAIVPGSYTPSFPSFNISAAKIDNIKTN